MTPAARRRGPPASGTTPRQWSLAVAVALFLLGCTDPMTARRIAEQDGVTQVETTGYRWFACGRDDVYQTGFRGLKNGRPVTGVVCGGWFKANTLRFD